MKNLKSVSRWKNWKECSVLLVSLLVFSLTVSLPGTARARIFIDINAPSVQKLRIAIPPFEGRSADIGEPDLGRKLAEVTANDLELSGYFLSIEKEAFLPGALKDVAGNNIQFKDWSVIGAELLLTCTYSSIGQSLELEARLYDVFRGRSLYTKRLLGKQAEYRALAHRLSNEILFLVTGQKGMFLSRLAYVNRAKGKKELNKEIFVCDVDGQGSRQITFDESIALLPRWSPMGDKLMYVSFRDGGPMLYLKDLATGVDRRISSRTGLNTGASWAPDGKSVALTLSHGDNPDVYTIDTGGKIQNRITNHWGIDVSPAFSPDGRKIAFVSNRSGSPQIYIHDLASGSERRLTFEGKYNTSPAWSAQNRIAFSGMHNGSIDIFTIHEEGTGLCNLTEGQGKNEDPCWSPDGQYLVFTSNRTGSYHLYLMTAGGQNQRQITFQKGEQSSPSWSPF